MYIIIIIIVFKIARYIYLCHRRKIIALVNENDERYFYRASYIQ